MEKDIVEFIDDLLSNDARKLRRSIGVGLYLYNKLKDRAPDYLLESLQTLDRFPFEKKKAIVLELKRILGQRKPSNEVIAGLPKKPIKSFLVPVDKLKLLETKEKKLLKSLGIKTLFDALYYFPLKYEDRRVISSLKLAKPGQKLTLKLKVREVRKIEDKGYTVEVICTDGEDHISLRFRYKKVDFLFVLYRKGKEVVVSGKVRTFRGEKYIVHPELLKEGEYGEVFPIYYIRAKGDITRISSRERHNRIRKALKKLVLRASFHIPEYLPQNLVDKYSFPYIGECIKKLHMPEGINPDMLNSFRTAYHRRAIYDDLFLFQLALLLKKRETEKEKAPSIRISADKLIVEFENRLNFRLTEAQRKALREILLDMGRDKPMNRLLQGDVGSGKTVVAMGASLAAVENGYQVAVMVPTEILAHQHYVKFKEIFRDFGVEVCLLTGSLKPSQKRSVYRHIREGNVNIVIGTHALIQDKVEFKKLGLVIIDEQHRFGVMQRKYLLEKGKGLYPHCLVMSATPIPRTLALSVYGDLDISVIDELPPGRKKVRTRLIFESEREKLINAIRDEVSKGNKVYIIYPLIEESEKADFKAATEGYQKWKELLPDMNIHLLHGRMSDEEKKEVVDSFRASGDILVSTTVVEVGVDVPEATLMIVEDAHRFGLSQLHQLRGRVGRSDRESFCYLVVPDSLKGKDTEALKRLKVLVRTQDGFKVAEMDMKFRGPGELLGVSQSGYFGFNIANLARSQDRELLQKAREDAKTLLEEDPSLERYPALKELLLYKYGDRFELSYIA